MGQNHSPGRRAQRRVDAEKRQEAIDRLAPEDRARHQMEALDRRLGEGVGAKKERAKLAKALDV